MDIGVQPDHTHAFVVGSPSDIHSLSQPVFSQSFSAQNVALAFGTKDQDRKQASDVENGADKPWAVSIRSARTVQDISSDVELRTSSTSMSKETGSCRRTDQTLSFDPSH